MCLPRIYGEMVANLTCAYISSKLKRHQPESTFPSVWLTSNIQSRDFQYQKESSSSKKLQKTRRFHVTGIFCHLHLGHKNQPFMGKIYLFCPMDP